MFVHTSHLPQVLPAAAYWTQEQHERERSQVFANAWQCVASLADFPRVGSFLTTDLLDQPLLLYRGQNSVRCFLNVCPHRFSLLTSRPAGAMVPLRCQYHGWEFDESGCTRRIPDARSFKPLHDGQLALKQLRTEIWSQLVFVALTDEAPPLAEFLGDVQARCENWFSRDRHMIFRRTVDLSANWKVKVENTLESYHIECVHPRTFGRSPAAENCFHELNDAGSRFWTNEPPPSRRQQVVDTIMYQLIGLARDPDYEHYIVYPNFMFGKAGVFTWVEIVTPIDRHRCQTVITMFASPAARRNPISRLAYRVFCGFGRRYSSIALDEDAAIVVAVQRGLEALEQPRGGLISVREERVFHFQQYIDRVTR